MCFYLNLHYFDVFVSPAGGGDNLKKQNEYTPTHFTSFRSFKMRISDNPFSMCVPPLIRIINTLSRNLERFEKR